MKGKIVLVSLILVTLLISISFSFDFKSKYGVEGIFVPLLEAQTYGISVNYSMGTKLYGIEKIGDLYGYIGGEFGYMNILGHSAFEFSIPISLLAVANDFSFKVFGSDVIPALIYSPKIYYDTLSGFDLKTGDIYGSLLFKTNKKGTYYNFVFWPFPVYIGFSVLQF